MNVNHKDFSKKALLACVLFAGALGTSAQQIDMKKASSLPKAVKPILGDKQYINDPVYSGYMPWHQYAPFNNDCPLKNGQRTATGCVATSMAMVMSAHKHPVQGKGYVEYFWNGQKLSRDFSNSIYNWNLLKYRYGYGDTEQQTKFISCLLRDCGYSVEMIYGTGYDGSGASEEKAAKALVHNFDYDRSIAYLCRDYCGTEYWENMLRTEIAAGRPVIYGGGSSYGAHEFVCDGYDENGKFFFHMGSTGKDGYYGTTDDALTYTSGQTAIYRIMKPSDPEASHVGSMVAGCNRHFYWEEGNRISANVRFFTPVDAVVADCAVAVENTQTHQITYVDQRTFFTSNIPNDPTLFTDFTVNGTFANGIYDVYPVYRQHAAKEWEKVLFGDYCQDHVTLRVNNGVKTFSNENISEVIDAGKTKIAGIIYKVNDAGNGATVTFQNNGYNSYSGDVVIPETVEIKGKTYPVTTIGVQAFSNCTKLNSVVIPASVTLIEYGAFYNCSAPSITFAEGSKLKTIGASAFQGSDITSMVLPDGLQTIYNEAFASCYSLTDVVIPASVTQLFKGAFATCIFLKNITCKAQTPLALSSSETPFTNFYASNFQSITLHVPAGCADAYRSALVWSEFGKVVETGARRINKASSQFDDTLTGINFNNEEKTNNEAFDLQGRRITTASKGLLIQNGYKIIK